jgi:ABC-type uncharacterized transport system auxiliary subunit
MRAIILLCVLACSTGCLPGAKPPHLIDYYTLAYETPRLPGNRPVQAIRVERFSAAGTINNTAMLYSKGLYHLDQYNYSQWRTYPADLVADFLLRDFRESGLFKAVFSYRTEEEARFVIEGGIEKLVMVQEDDSTRVCLILQITLIDRAKEEVDRKVLFQKRYSLSEPTSRKTPEDFAKGASDVMAKVSAQIITDVYDAISLQERK